MLLYCWIVDISGHVALVDAHPHVDVPADAPAGGPAVLDDPVLVAVAAAGLVVADGQDGMVDAGLAAAGVVVDTAGVGLEAVRAGVNQDGEGGVGVQAVDHVGLVHGGHVAVAGDLDNSVGSVEPGGQREKE